MLVTIVTTTLNPPQQCNHQKTSIRLTADFTGIKTYYRFLLHAIQLKRWNGNPLVSKWFSYQVNNKILQHDNQLLHTSVSRYCPHHKEITYRKLILIFLVRLTSPVRKMKIKLWKESEDKKYRIEKS